MKNLYIAPGLATPEVKFTLNEMELYISGKSYPSNPAEFYRPVFDCIGSVLNEENIEKKFSLVFKLDYCNTSSSKQFVKLFNLFQNSDLKKEVRVKWFYDEKDIDMFEAGQRFSQYSGLTFEFLKK